MKKNNWGRNKSIKLKRRCFIIALIIIIFSALTIIEIQIKPIIYSIASQDAHLEVVKIINESVSDQIGRGISYSHLVNIETDENGTVSYIQPDTIKISRISTAIAQELEERLNDLDTENFDFPLGLLTGYILLADKGPSVHFKVTLVGDIEVSITDEFIEAGINQTKHRIVLNIGAEMCIFIPFDKKIVDIQDSLPLAESIIVGPIPETYLHFENENGITDEQAEILRGYTNNNGNIQNR